MGEGSGGWSEAGKGGQLRSSTVKHIVMGAAGAQSHWGLLGGGEDMILSHFIGEVR